MVMIQRVIEQFVLPEQLTECVLSGDDTACYRTVRAPGTTDGMCIKC